jgi:glutathione S-transferase
MLDIALAWVGERFRPKEKQSMPHSALWEAKIRACVDALETEAGALAAGPLTIGHIGIGVALSYLDFRFDDLQWREEHKRLAAWYATFDARPSVTATPVVDDR